VPGTQTSGGSEHAENSGPSWAPVAGLLVVCGALAASIRSVAAPISDTDVWWNLRIGEIMSHRVWWQPAPRLSTFATATWTPSEPLPDVVGAQVEHWWGLPGLAWLYGAGLAAVLVTTYLAFRRVGDVLPAALASTLTLLALTQSLTPRPELVSLCLMPVVVVAWLRTAHDLVPRWWLVPLTYGWSMCHGFWSVGAGIGVTVAAVLLISGRARGAEAVRLVVVAIASFAVVALTPAGPGVVLEPLVVRARSSYIIEWYRTDLLTPAPLVVLVMLAGTVALVIAQRRYEPVRIVLLVIGAFFVWYSTRTVSIGGVLAGVLLVDALQAVLESRGAPLRPVRLPELGGLMGWSLVCLTLLAVAVPRTSDSVAVVPTAFDGRLDTLPAGTVVFNNYEVGGWLSWRHPDLDHYVDPLADAYSVSHLDHYLRALDTEPGWQRTVQASGARVAVLQQAAPLSRALEREGWTTAAESRGYVLLTAPGPG